MSSSATTRVLLLAVAVVSAVGVVDSVIGDVWDHVVLFSVAGLLALVLLVATNWRRRPIPVRGDHARWLSERSRVTGEEVDRIADRALATYRRALDPDPGETS